MSDVIITIDVEPGKVTVKNRTEWGDRFGVEITDQVFLTWFIRELENAGQKAFNADSQNNSERGE